MQTYVSLLFFLSYLHWSYLYFIKSQVLYPTTIELTQHAFCTAVS